MRKNPELYSTLDRQQQQQQARVQQQRAGPAPEPAAPAAAAAAAGVASPVPAEAQPGPGAPPRLACRPEVLAPAGGWPQMRAAVENGADAVYFGLSDFNARARAANFDPEELPEVGAAAAAERCLGAAPP
jgi:hypothetical protein